MIPLSLLQGILFLKWKYIAKIISFFLCFVSKTIFQMMKLLHNLSLSVAASTLKNMLKKEVLELRPIYEDIRFARADFILAMNKLLNKRGRRHNNQQGWKIRKTMIAGRSRFNKHISIYFYVSLRLAYI